MRLINILISLTVFFSTVFIHWLLYKKFPSLRTLKTAFVIFFCGLLIVIIRLLFIKDNIIITPILYYLLFSISFIIYLSPVLLSDQSPSNTIMEIIQKSQKATIKDLQKQIHINIYIKKRLRACFKS